MKFPSRPSAVGFLILAVQYYFPLSTALHQTENLRGKGQDSKSNRRLDVTNKYIIVFNKQPEVGTDATLDPNVATIKVQIESSVASLGGTVTHSYTHALNAFAATLTPDAYNALITNPNIAYIEPDGIVSVSAIQTQDLSWGLDRIDQKTGKDNRYTYSATGAGVHAYIIDTGICSTHREFSGRLGNGYNAVTGGESSPQPWDDCHFHGTHVSSTIGGTRYGVAKQVTLHAVRVLDCSGSGLVSDVIAGIDWVASQHSQNPGQKSVANLSLGGDKTVTINQAATKLVAAGVVLSVAAGNEQTDACTKSPASADNVLTVGATDSLDARASFSNYGPCVELFAPGNNILGASLDCPDYSCSLTISGTSMATPHVTGVAALYLQKNGGTPADVMSAILNTTVADVVTDSRTTPNKFLQSKPEPLKLCRASGKSCRRKRCLLFLACCCNGLSCQSNSRCG